MLPEVIQSLSILLSIFRNRPPFPHLKITFLSHLKHAFLGNKEKVKCASGKVAYRACDKVLLNKILMNCFITVIHLPLIKGEVGGEKEILDF